MTTIYGDPGPGSIFIQGVQCQARQCANKNATFYVPVNGRAVACCSPAHGDDIRAEHGLEPWFGYVDGMMRELAGGDR